MWREEARGHGLGESSPASAGRIYRGSAEGRRARKKTGRPRDVRRMADDERMDRQVHPRQNSAPLPL